MLKDVIANLLERHQDKMLAGQVADIPDAQMSAQPIAGMNHPAWLLGHILGLEHKVATSVMGRSLSLQLPADWWDIYGIGSTPKAEPKLYKSKAFYMQGLDETSKAIAAYIREMKDADLANPLPDPLLAKSFPNFETLLVALPTHRAYHAGQIAIWR